MAIKVEGSGRQVKDIQLKIEGDSLPPSNSIIINVPSAFREGYDAKVHYTGDKANEISTGEVFTIDSLVLGETKNGEEKWMFSEGILDIQYLVEKLTKNATGKQGDKFVTGTGFEDYVEDYDSVLAGEELYDINGTADTEGGTKLYLTKPLKNNVTSIKLFNKETLKVRNSVRTDYILSKLDYRYDPREAVMKVGLNSDTSKLQFAKCDYEGANKTLQENLRIGKFLGILTGSRDKF